MDRKRLKEGADLPPHLGILGYRHFLSVNANKPWQQHTSLRHQYLVDHVNQYTPCRRAIVDVGSLGRDNRQSWWVDMVNPFEPMGASTLLIRRFFYLAGGLESSPTIGGGFLIPSILTCGGINLDNNSGEDANSCLVKS